MNMILSGCHINPAVSWAMLITGRMSIMRFFLYTLAQFIGAFLGALVVFIVYIDALKAYKPSMYSLDTAGVYIDKTI
jgi:glycerol uptake facilitator-like aquaporin